MKIYQILLALSVLLMTSVGFSQSAQAGCTDYPAAGVDWSKCRKRSVILSGNDFKGAKFIQTDVFGSDMRDSDFSGADFTKAILTRVNISNSNLTNSNLSKAEGNRSVFKNTNLTGATLEKAEMFRSDFSEADLTGANVNKAELGRANFAKANLSGAQITFTNLARANFTSANLDDADLKNSWTYLTRFESVDLRQVKNLTQDQLELACGNDETVLPSGLKKPSNWPCSSEE